MTNLYDINEDIRQINDLLDAAPDDVALVDTLEGLEGHYSLKVDSCLKVRAMLLAGAVGAATEAARLSALAKSRTAKAAQLELYVASAMQARGKDKLATDLFNLTLRQAGKKLGDVNDDLVPDKYKTMITSTTIDRRALLADAKISDINGVGLIDTKRALIIK